MDVSLSILRRLNLDNQVNIWNVQSTGCNISGYENIELTLLKSLKGYLTLILCNVTMHNFDILFDFISQN